MGKQNNKRDASGKAAQNKRSPSAKSRRGGGKRDKFSNKQRAVESVDMRKDVNAAELREIEDDYHKGTPNDWRWYAQTPQLVKDNASFPFGDPLGLPIRWNSSTAQLSNNAVPGVCALTFSPCIGWADSENSPINVAARRLYSFVVHANSRNPSYDAADLMLYYVVVDSMIMFLESIKRLYGVMLGYTPYNRYYPKALVKAMGYDFDDIEKNLNSLRAFINQYAVKLNQLWIPTSLSYSARHAWMCSGTYVDSTSEKAQTLMYVPDSFYQFSLNSEGAGSATLKQFYGNKTYANIVEFGNSLINTVLPNQDFGLISGDILKAFGAAGILQITGIGEAYQVLPVYNKEVLMQMENATVFGQFYSATDTGFSADITQKTAVGSGYLVSAPRIYIGGVAEYGVTENNKLNAVLMCAQPYLSNQLINMHGSEWTTPEMVMVATRLTNIVDDTFNAPWASITPGDNSHVRLYFPANITTAGSEVITSCSVYYYTGSGFLTSVRCPKVPLAGTGGTIDQTAKNVASMLQAIEAITQFDWHFGVYPTFVATDETGAAPSNNILPIQDLDTYTTLSKDNLKQLTATALLSQFSVPQI